MTDQAETSVSILSLATGANEGNPETGEASFKPRFPFDIDTDRAKRFEELVDQYDGWHADEPATGPLPVTTGVHTVTPEMAEELLRRNLPGTNRKAALPTIIYYAQQMQ